jgi:predicted signal transduction protein with EAL and GGDEF domain
LLETLRAFPFDKIKLDRSFMSEIETSSSAKAIIRAVMALSKSLDIPVLAEGIETEGQLSILDREGCHEAQGYLLGRPACLEQIVGSGQLSLIEAHPVYDAAGWRRRAENPTPVTSYGRRSRCDRRGALPKDHRCELSRTERPADFIEREEWE